MDASFSVNIPKPKFELGNINILKLVLNNFVPQKLETYEEDYSFGVNYKKDVMKIAWNVIKNDGK